MREWNCLPLVASPSPSSLWLGAQRWSSYRFIIAHKAARLKARALIRRGAAPGGLTPGHTDPARSHITQADTDRLGKVCSLVSEREKIYMGSLTQR